MADNKDWMSFLHQLEETFPDGEVMDSTNEDAEPDLSREPYFVYRSWFVEFIVPYEERRSDSFRSYLQFQFNFTAEDRKRFKKLAAMGLLGFHFDHPISRYLQEEGLPVEAYMHGSFSTNFMISCPNVNLLKSVVSQIQSKHLDLMELAMELLNSVCLKYNVSAE